MQPRDRGGHERSDDGDEYRRRDCRSGRDLSGWQKPRPLRPTSAGDLAHRPGPPDDLRHAQAPDSRSTSREPKCAPGANTVHVETDVTARPAIMPGGGADRTMQRRPRLSSRSVMIS